MGFFKWFDIMELNSALDAMTQAYCKQLCCYSYCGGFERTHTHGQHASTRHTLTVEAAYKHTLCKFLLVLKMH